MCVTIAWAVGNRWGRVRLESDYVSVGKQEVFAFARCRVERLQILAGGPQGHRL